MADSAVNFLLEKVTNILLQNASLIGDVHNEIEEIKLELESMKSFLRDAERRKERSEIIETWVRQVREVAYEVEDIIDEFMHGERGRRRKGLNRVAHNTVNFPKKIISRHRICSKLQKVKTKVHEVSERSKRYGFDILEEGKQANPATGRWQHHRDLSAFVDEDEIVGMEENSEKLFQWLTEDELRRTVISIVGMGGLGKTTLVTRVYNDQIIKRHFDCRAWVSVSQAYGVEELLRGMIGGFGGENQMMAPGSSGSLTFVQLVRMLIDYLHHKRYVIVLDDVWSIYLWGKIRGAFPNNRNGSRIILTTRNENIAASVGIGSRVHRLEPLRDTDAWALFCNKAFWNHPDHSCPKGLEELARVILNKCEGLPLAIVAVGSLMSSREDSVMEWEKVCKSLSYHLNDNPMLEQVKAILLMSFNDLPFHLKHCFLYCCIFRDGYPIKRKKLIRLWVAEGFIIERKGMTMEEAAEDDLKELIFRSMIQVTETNDGGRVKTCRVHDVMRELAMKTSERENFFTVYDDDKKESAMVDGRAQRLLVYNKGGNIQLSRRMSRQLRSFFVLETDMHPVFSLRAVSFRFKLLRVLDVEGVSIESVPSELVTLFNLSYMNLRGTQIRELPNSLERLRNLQTLDVRNTYVERLPNGTSELPQLRHLYVLRRCGDHDSGPCDYPQSESVQAPAGIWNVQSLQTLACIEAGVELVERVGNLTELRHFEITKLRAVDGPKLCSSIQKMTQLHRLGITAIDEEELQLEALPMLPPLFLQKLTLSGTLRCFPSWVRFLPNLTHLYLGWSRLDKDILSSLHALPALVFLQLRKAYNGRFLNFKAQWFPRLRKLRLMELVHLESVRVEEGALPSIRELCLISCPKLKWLPDGIEHLAVAGLQKLQLEEMPRELVQNLLNDMSEEDRARIQRIPTVNLVFLKGQTRVVETLD